MFVIKVSVENLVYNVIRLYIGMINLHTPLGVTGIYINTKKKKLQLNEEEEKNNQKNFCMALLPY